MARSRPDPVPGLAAGPALPPPDVLAGEDFPPPPRQERSRRKREALLDAALALFAERGFEGAGIEDIAGRAGIAVGGFYQHFRSKRQALLVLMDRWLGEVAALDPTRCADALTAAPVAIGALVRDALRLDWGYAGAYRAWREAALADPALGALQREMEAWTRARIGVVLRAALRAPGARRAVDGEALAWAVNLLFWRLAETPADNTEAAVAAVSAMLHHALFEDGIPLPGTPDLTR